MKSRIFFPIVFSYICGAYVSIQYSALYSISAIPLGMFSSIFLLPPIILFFVFEIKDGNSNKKFFAFFLVFIFELFAWLLYFLLWYFIPNEKKDEEVDEILWVLLKLFMAGTFGSFLGLIIYPKIREYL